MSCVIKAWVIEYFFYLCRMNILLIHNNYGVYSGEEAVVDRQMALFRKIGHHVYIYRKTTEGLRETVRGNFKGLLQGFYSSQSIKEIKQIMKTDKPDIVVIHNLYPYISPAVLKHIKKVGVPIVMTVHNYRLMCPTGLFMRNARPCELCLKGNEWKCILHNCEHSVMKSLGYAGRNWYARITKAYSGNVDIFACITAFQTQKLTEAGFDKDKMIVIPNFVDELTEPVFKEGEYIGISGRVSREKGFDLLLEVARKTPDIQYVFAGTVRNEDKDLLNNAPDNCKFLGHLSKDKLAEFYINSRFMVIASRWYEGFPMTILDASSYGKATIGPAHAGFLEVIDNNITGLHFIPGDAIDLQQKIEKLWNAPEACLEMGYNATQKLKANYSMDVIKVKWGNLLDKAKKVMYEK